MDCAPSAKTTRGPFSSSSVCATGRSETFLGPRGVPDESVIFSDEHIGMAVAVEIDELEIRISQVAVQARGEGAEGLPAFGVVMLVQAGGGALQDDDVG